MDRAMMFNLAAMVLIFGGGLLGGLVLPRKFRGAGDSHRGVHAGNAFAGGVFLGAGLLHLLPDAIEGFKSFSKTDFPLAALLAGCGFLFVLFLNEVWARGESEESLAGSRKKFPWVLLLVLSIHSIITGASLGLESSIASSLALFIAVMAHKSGAAFALGIRMGMSDAKLSRQKLIIVLFSCMTPLGILLGVVCSALLSADGAVKGEAIFDAIAAGTFINIAVLDIIDDVFKDKKDSMLRFALVLAGFAMMALIAIWA